MVHRPRNCTKRCKGTTRNVPSKSADALKLKSLKLGLVEIFGDGLSFAVGALEDVRSRVRSKPCDDMSRRWQNAQAGSCIKGPSADALTKTITKIFGSGNALGWPVRGGSDGAPLQMCC